MSTTLWTQRRDPDPADEPGQRDHMLHQAPRFTQRSSVEKDG